MHFMFELHFELSMFQILSYNFMNVFKINISIRFDKIHGKSPVFWNDKK